MTKREYNKNKNRKTEVINIRISRSQKNQINGLSEKLNLNQSEIIRLGIENIINQNNSEEK